jgi:DNA modification methylase
MCGDAACQRDVEQLMGTVKANLIFTDPPYNVNYQGIKHIKKRSKKMADRTLYNDNLSPEAYFSLLQAALTNAATYSELDASLYLCNADLNFSALQSILTTADYTLRSVLVWVKQHFVLNFARYKTQHEPILYCHRTGQSDAWFGDNKQSTLWQFDRPMVSDLHPTMKPVALIQQALHNSSLPGDRVLDLFGGSGSTLIACHYSQRQAYIMEIQPNYIDTIVRRWQL